MQVPFLDISRQHDRIRKQLNSAISGVVDASNFILGSEVKAFEEEFASYLGVTHCITCANGTDALELALQVLEIGPGDEVIVPAFGWPSAILAVEKSGALPVLADVVSATACIDFGEVEKLITPDTKAIIAIHLFGHPSEADRLRKFCDRLSVNLIEDCAQAHGAELNGIKVGSFGHLAVFSFYPTKNLGCLGDGGAIVTSESALAEKLKALRDYGRSNGQFRVPFGRNSRLDEIQAAVLRVKLPYLDEWNAERAETMAHYRRKMGANGLLELSGAHYKIPLAQERRDRLVSYLRQVGVGCESVQERMAPAALSIANPRALMLRDKLVNVPMFVGITKKEIDFCCDQIGRFNASAQE